jgi:hypothetical protein
VAVSQEIDPLFRGKAAAAAETNNQGIDVVGFQHLIIFRQKYLVI